MRFDPKAKIEDKDIISMLQSIADNMFMSGEKKMSGSKLGITCYAFLDKENYFRVKYSINREDILAYIEQFIIAKVRHFYCWNMGIEIVIDIDQEDPLRLYCDGRKILKDCKTPEFEGVFNNEEKLWHFQRRSWT